MEKNKGLVVSVIVLLAAVLLLGGYITYDKTNNNSKEIKKDTIKKNNNTDIKQLSKKEVEMYLSYVPTTDTFQSKYIDAYNGSESTINNINQNLIYSLAFDNTNETTQRPSDSNNKARCVKKSDYKSNLLKMYNKILDTDKFNYLTGIGEINNNLVCIELDTGVGLGFEKVSKVEKYELDRSNIYIYEKAGFINNSKIYTNTFDLENSENENKYLINSIDENINTDDIYSKFESKFKTFKHKFTKNKNGDYYWSSTIELK